MKKTKYLIFILAAFLFLGLYNPSKAFAASLEFDPTEKTSVIDEIVELNLNINPASKSITSVDAYILYDQDMLEIQDITYEDYFPGGDDVNFKIISEPGKAYYGGMAITGEFKTVIGTAAKVSFKALKEGSTTVSFYCDITKNDTSKIIEGGTLENIVTCGENKSSVITIGAGSEEQTPTEASSSTDDESSSDDGTGGTDTAVDTTDNVTELPQSGILDNILRISLPGIALLLIGAALKLLL